MSAFKFDLGELVRIRVSGERGHVIGRAEYLYVENQYCLEYKAADGRAVVDWWNEASLEAVTDRPAPSDRDLDNAN